MLKYKKGNIIDAFISNEIDVLVQGCNCFCNFGKGFAEELLNRLRFLKPIHF